jgi:chromosomal replication initiator protein
MLRIPEIQEKVAKYFGVRPKSMKGKKRVRNIARPRQVAMYLCRKCTNKSFTQIAEQFNRDHTTIIHGCQTIDSLIKTDAELADDVNRLILLCQQDQAKE